MNCVERLQAAIEKLEALRDQSFAGPWSAFHSGVSHGDHSYVMADHNAILSVSANDGEDEEYRAPTAELVVILHRAIDAQLGILRAATSMWTTAREEGHAMNLADAILGTP